MKFLHTADLHIGKKFNDFNFLADQEIVLNEIADIADRENVDAVLIAGDVYQSASPTAEAMSKFNHFITRITQKHAVYLIAGNHDSDERIAYYRELVRGAGLFVSHPYKGGALQQETLRDENGEIVITLMPFLKPFLVKPYFPNKKIETYQDAVAAVLSATPIDHSKRNILLSHQYVTGAERSDSEDVIVGGLDNIDANVYEGFDYVALGHMHSPQTVGSEMMRYAGSPMKYSFSEEHNEKGVLIIDMPEKGSTTVRKVPLHAPHDMRTIEGYKDEIFKMPSSDDYVRIILHDEDANSETQRSLRPLFPNMCVFRVENSSTREDMTITDQERVEELDPLSLFDSFYREQHNGEAPTYEIMQVVENILKELEDK